MLLGIEAQIGQVRGFLVVPNPHQAAFVSEFVECRSLGISPAAGSAPSANVRWLAASPAWRTRAFRWCRHLLYLKTAEESCAARQASIPRLSCRASVR